MGKPHDFKKLDYTLMRRAIALAEEGRDTEGGGPFGALIVRENRVVAESHNTVSGKRDCTQHAELAAIQKACKNLGSKTLEDCILYTSCEPCMMCLGAIKWAKLKAVYFGASALDAKAYGFIYSDMYYSSDNDKRHNEFHMRQLLPEEAILVW